MKLSLVLPVYNESEHLRTFFLDLHQALTCSTLSIEYVFVDDGSTDDSLEKILELKDSHGAEAEFRITSLSRNFGHQAAVTAGIFETTGDAVVVMDTDMQDDPSAIPQFLEKWRDGYEVVYAVRSQRKENILFRLLFKAYYRVFSRVSHIKVPHDAGNYGLIDRKIVDTINSMPEHNRYFPGLRAWVGFNQTGVPVPRRARADGKSRVGVIGLIRLALDGIVSFSNFPLRIAFLLALLLGCFGFIGLLTIIYIKLFTGEAVIMWASIMCCILFFGAGQFFLIGLLGEYIGRIYSEVKQRPQYVVKKIID